MSYKSRYTGAQVDSLLGKCDGLPDIETLGAAFTEMQDADLASLSSSATATTRTVRAAMHGGSVKSVSLPAATESAAGVMSAADKTTLGELDRLSGVTMPLYMEGSPWVANANFLGGAEVDIPHSGSLTLTASDTGLKKKVFDRFLTGVPCCLLVPVIASASDMTVVSAVPFTLLGKSRMTGASRLTLSYRCAIDMGGHDGYDIDIGVTVNKSARTVTLSRSETEREAIPDTEPLLPFALDHFTINADGSVAPTGAAVTFNESSTGNLGKLYDRVQKGMPPAMGVWMTNSDGSRTLVWAYLDQVAASGKTKTYMSGSLANGTFSDKRLRVNLTDSRVQCSMLTASTT